MDGWMDGWMEGWVDGWMSRYVISMTSYPEPCILLTPYMAKDVGPRTFTT